MKSLAFISETPDNFIITSRGKYLLLLVAYSTTSLDTISYY
jgi:hypothetical protein